MKTVISIPDNVLLEHYNKDKITEKLNILYSNASAEYELNDADIESMREAVKNDTW